MTTTSKKGREVDARGTKSHLHESSQTDTVPETPSPQEKSIMHLSELLPASTSNLLNETSFLNLESTTDLNLSSAKRAEESDDYEDRRQVHDWLTAYSPRPDSECLPASEFEVDSSPACSECGDVFPESDLDAHSDSSPVTSPSQSPSIVAASMTSEPEELVSEIREALIANESESKDRASPHEALRYELERVKTELHNMSTTRSLQVQKLESDILSLARVISGQEAELAALRTERDTLKESMVNWNQTLESHLVASRDSQSKHQARMEEMMEEICSLKRTGNSRVQEMKETSRDERDSQALDFEDSDSDDAEDDLRALEAVFDGLQKNQSAMKQALAKVHDSEQAEMASLKAQRDSLRETLHEKEDELMTLRAEMDAVKESTAGQQFEELETLRRIRSDLHSQLERTSREMNDLKGSYDKKQRELREVWDDRLSFRRELEAVTQELQTAQEKDRYNREALENFSRREKKERERTLNQLTTLRAQLERASAENNKLMESECAKQVEITRLTLSELTLQGDIRQKDREIEELTSRLQIALSEQTEQRKMIEDQANRIRQLEETRNASSTAAGGESELRPAGARLGSSGESKPLESHVQAPASTRRASWNFSAAALRDSDTRTLPIPSRLSLGFPSEGRMQTPVYPARGAMYPVEETTPHSIGFGVESKGMFPGVE